LVLTLRRGIEQGLVADGQGEAHADSRAPVDRVGEVVPSVAPPLVVTKDRLNRVLACEAHHDAAEFGERTYTTALACGAIIDVLFRQLVTVGSIDDPVADGLSALSVDDNQRDLVSWIGQLPQAARDELFAEVERQAGGLLRRWPALDPGWMPRTQEALRVRLAGGAVELSARVDLAIGRPVEDRASVAIVEVKSGARRVEHRADLHFYALIEALRNPAPPFVVATYYTRTGELDVDPVSGELLVAAARRTLAGIRSLGQLAAGAEPRRTPNGLCGSCAALPECDPGRRHTGVGGGPVPDGVRR
jgi:PD-(D/E)XK nuclease superfamily